MYIDMLLFYIKTLHYLASRSASISSQQGTLLCFHKQRLVAIGVFCSHNTFLQKSNDMPLSVGMGHVDMPLSTCAFL